MAFDGNEDGPEMSDRTLIRLRRDDPALTSARATWKGESYVNCVNWTENGALIGNNTRLKALRLEVWDTSRNPTNPSGYRLEGAAKENFQAFCGGLASNRSIERLHIRYWNCPQSYTALLMGILAPFLEQNDNLSHLVMDSCEMDTDTVRLLASILNNRSNKGSLKRVEIKTSYIEEQDSGALIASLSQHYKISCLCLGGNSIGFRGCLALGNLIQNPNSQLQELYLKCNDLDDACIAVLSSALIKNPKLRKLVLSENVDITENGWRALSAVLEDPASTLEALHLADTSLDDAGAEAISNALATNTTLKILDLCFSESVTPDGWEAFFKTLQTNASSALEEINLGENEIDDEAGDTLASAFTYSGRLKNLQLRQASEITTAGWQVISNRLFSCNASLVELDLRSCGIGDEAAVDISHALTNSPSLRILNLHSNPIHSVGWAAFSTCLRTLALGTLKIGSNWISDDVAESLANSLTNMRTLKSLDLHHLHTVTPNGWRKVLAILADSPKLALEKLELSTNGIDDQGAVAYATTLTNNSTLKSLDLGTNRRLTDDTWKACSRLVCDRASITATYSSNHTIHQLYVNDIIKLPEDLELSLEMNRNSDKREVARHKILWFHFQGESVIENEVFFDMGHSVLPHAIAWAGRDFMGHSLLYQLLQTVPLILEHANNEQRRESQKRKRA